MSDGSHVPVPLTPGGDPSEARNSQRPPLPPAPRVFVVNQTPLRRPELGEAHTSSLQPPFLPTVSPIAPTSLSPPSEDGHRRVSFSVLTKAGRSFRNSTASSEDSDGILSSNSSGNNRSLKKSGLSFRFLAGKSSTTSSNSSGKGSDQDRRSTNSTKRSSGDASISSGSASFTTSLVRRSNALTSRLTTRSISTFDAGVVESYSEADTRAQAVYRRYRVGENVLVCNLQSRWANLVNRYGFPPGAGDTPLEQVGPYIYVLAQVKHVHYLEDAVFYTVTRADTGADQRADADYMEPLRTARGEAAALRAAKEFVSTFQNRASFQSHGSSHNSRGRGALDKVVACSITPFLWLYSCFYHHIVARMMKLCGCILMATKRQAHLLLNGMSPYICSARITAVNIVVVCSTWFMFVDQARLAFFPPGADNALSVISTIVWLILLLELLLEVFIRPEGYQFLVMSEKAYAPTTVRFINAFHLLVEFISLLVFVPEILCILTSKYSCGDRPRFSFFNAAYMAVFGPDRIHAFFGRAYFALIRLRAFGLVRHWKNMWINKTFINMRRKKSLPGNLFSNVLLPRRVEAKISNKAVEKSPDEKMRRESALEDASTIGTALMVSNSHRALMILFVIMGLFPLLGTLNLHGGSNQIASVVTRELQAMNLVAADTSDETCQFFADTIYSWLFAVAATKEHFTRTSRTDAFLLTLQIEPVRCETFFGGNGSTSYGVITSKECDFPPYESGTHNKWKRSCLTWSKSENGPTQTAEQAGVRNGAVSVFVEERIGNITTAINGLVTGSNETLFRVTASFNQSASIESSALASFLLQLCLLICVLGGLSVLRRDAELLVLGPLRRMLKIVAQYAKNPLAPAKVRSTVKRKASADAEGDSDSSSSSDNNGDHAASQDQLGNYETERLITAVSKITDLLRKCWGVAGADIISTNLATREGALTEVFNPTVPGRSVYALFAFACINGFDHMLRNLGGDVMILINDVAAVLHGEVFRWGFGDSGQCNKNLGSAFLMVFRIGLVKEVIRKLEQATDVVFSTGTSKFNRLRKRHVGKQLSYGSHTNSRTAGHTKLAAARNVARQLRRKVQRTKSVNKAMGLSLQSLPGISAFTDRAVIGMLKSFAGIYRDRKLRAWKNDFRLGAGVGAFSVNMIFGMDAGWAVEGAVGSEYKIDATYLSPHVNMASRMMSACKQYGVSILLSQAVQELMSDVARSKLRHLDVVTVKGSSVKQKIFTYDARHKGVDFFLYSRSDEQADVEADRYSPNMWNTDQDLKAMRQHVTDDFIEEFDAGRKAYLSGDWINAIKRLETANEIMVETVTEEGYIQDELNELQGRVLDGEDIKAAEEELRNETGDGPSRFLINYMKSKGCIAPEDWDGWHPLTSK